MLSDRFSVLRLVVLPMNIFDHHSLAIPHWGDLSHVSYTLLEQLCFIKAVLEENMILWFSK